MPIMITGDLTELNNSASSFKSGRKFHDSWACYLFIATVTIVNTILLMNSRSISFLTESESNYTSYIIYNFLLFLVFTSLAFVMSSFLPKVTIIGGMIGYFILSVITFIKSNESLNWGSYLMFFLDMLFFVTIAIAIYWNFKFLVKILSVGAKLMLKNIHSIFFVMVINFIISSIIIFPSVVADNKKEIVGYLKYVSLLLFFWSMYISSYFNIVFVSGMVSEIISQNTEYLITSLKNTFMAFGSICLGALILAIVKMLQNIVNTKKNNNNKTSSSGGNLLLLISYLIVVVLLKFIEESIKFANNMIYPYMSINGTSYKESLLNSFDEICKSGFSKVIALGALSKITSLFSFIYIHIGINIIIFSNVVKDLTSFFISIMILLLFYSAFNSLFSMIESASMGILFKCIKSPDDVIKFDQELYSVVVEKNEELQKYEDKKTKNLSVAQ